MFAFGTVTAMILPIVTAVLGLAASLAIIKLLGHVIEVPSVAPTLATMIGLGVGIDYSLFIVTRHKLQLKDGMEMRESIARAAATAGGAVVFAGITVVIALVSLVFSGIPFVGNMGYSRRRRRADRGHAPRSRCCRRCWARSASASTPCACSSARPTPTTTSPTAGRAGRAASSTRPWRSLVASVAFLLVLALPVLDLQLGRLGQRRAAQEHDGPPGVRPDDRGLRPGLERPAADRRRAGLAGQARPEPDQPGQPEAGPAQPADRRAGAAAGGHRRAGSRRRSSRSSSRPQSQSQQLAQQKKLAESPATDTRLTDLENAIKKDPGIKSVSQATVDKKGTVAVFTAIPTTAPSTPDTIDTVNRLRDTVIPNAIKGKDMTVFAGGQTAGYIDLAARIADKLPQMILIVVGLSFIV